jgi:hypothetical protein
MMPKRVPEMIIRSLGEGRTVPINQSFEATLTMRPVSSGSSRISCPAR